MCVLRKHFRFNYRPLLSIHWTRRDLNALIFSSVMPGIEVVEVRFAVFRQVSYNPTLGIASVVWRIPGNGIWTYCCCCCVRNRCQSEVRPRSPTPEFKSQSLPKIHPIQGATCLRQLPVPKEHAHRQWYSVRPLYQPSVYGACPGLI